MELAADPYFFAVAIPAVIITGLSKGGFGGGVAMLGTPLLALVIPPVTAAAIMLPVLIVMDAIGLWNYRGLVKWSIIRTMLPGALAGIGIGWATAAYVPDSAIRIIVGLIAVIFAIAQIVADFRKRAAAPENTALGMIWGTVAGFTSFVAHAGGPPYQAYTLPMKLDKLLYAGTGVVFFAIVNAVKVGPYLVLGQFSRANLALSGKLLPVAILGVLAGIWMVRRVSQIVFYRITYGAMITVGTKLVYDGIAAIVQSYL
jgi:uncharacterized protein